MIRRYETHTAGSGVTERLQNENKNRESKK